MLAHVTRSESKETTTVLIKQLHLHAMSLCAFTVLNFGLCFVLFCCCCCRRCRCRCRCRCGCGCCCCCCCCCGCCRSSAFSPSFCRSRLYSLPLKHFAASTAARFNFLFADGCFNVWSPLSPTCPCAIQLTSCQC